MRIATILKSLALVVGVSLLFSLAGCKSTKRVGTVGSGSAKEHHDFFVAMQKHEIQYNTLAARMNVELQLPDKSVNSRVELKMVKDQLFQLSVQPFLGIEVFRIEVSVDSVKIIDRMNKQYVAERYSDLKESTPIEFNFYNLQALFTNQLFLPGQKGIAEKQFNRFRLNQEGQMAEIKTTDAMGLNYTFMADGDEKLLSTRVADSADRYQLRWDYSDFRLHNNRPFPLFMDVQLLSGGKASGGLKITYLRVQTDESFNLDTTIPPKYTRISFAQIVKAISNSSN